MQRGKERVESQREDLYTPSLHFFLDDATCQTFNNFQTSLSPFHVEENRVSIEFGLEMKSTLPIMLHLWVLEKLKLQYHFHKSTRGHFKSKDATPHFLSLLPRDNTLGKNCQVWKRTRGKMLLPILCGGYETVQGFMNGHAGIIWEMPSKRFSFELKAHE